MLLLKPALRKSGKAITWNTLRPPNTHAQANPTVIEQDPLWKLRHALAGMALALLLSVGAAALAGSLLGDAFGGGYSTRAGIYAALLIYAVVGAVVLFVKVAQHETQPVSMRRVLRWFASLWLWPALLAVGRKSV